MLTTTSSALQARLEHMLDERDIHEVLVRYCRGVDRCDAELIASCYFPDAVDDHGNWQSTGAEVAAHIVSLVQPGPDSAMHFLGNYLIEVEGNIAHAESYVLAFRSSAKEDQPVTRTRAVRFIDRFERRNGEWRIAKRLVVDEFNRIDAIAEKMPDTDRFLYGRKDRTDPVYQTGT